MPLHKFSSFLLVRLTLSSKSWSLRWIILDNAILTLSSLSLSSLIEEIAFLIFWRVFTLFCRSFVPVWIIIKLGFFEQWVGQNQWSHLLLLQDNFLLSLAYYEQTSRRFILDHRIACNKNLSLYRCHLIKLLLSLPLFIYSLLFHRSFYKSWFVYWSFHYW